MSKVLAIITARGGSKRIPRKNIRNFLGKPIISYSIEAAIASGIFDETMVSTDDIEIAEIAKSFGAIIPFMRSEARSNDHANTVEVITEVLEEYRKRGKEFEYVVCIYPTAPFITAEKLRNAYDLILRYDAKSVVPIVRYSFPILRSFKIEDGLVKMNWPEYISAHSQDLPPAYHDCGQFYFLNTSQFMIEKKLFTDLTIPIEMPESEVQDIDNEEDWKLAEIKYKNILCKKSKND
ncbi:pseudaminic acid cytidylyltransferase [Daejeonella sp.]|uniref:pseudaminic acid cytidylyltransferase n=1 Tax=Daejeonella sp. TaxID=2805397 RepID=UPI0025C153FD|nr:pseudaminic acid cytidylyltransferase [Daejeonella sp.]